MAALDLPVTTTCGTHAADTHATSISTLLRRDAVCHAHRIVGIEPRGVVVVDAEGTLVKLVVKARAELPERRPSEQRVERSVMSCSLLGERSV